MSLAVILVSGMLLIVLSADYFTNGVEWLGQRLHLGEGAVGSLLAALGTALPETLVPVIAIVFGTSTHHNAIGLGAILGAPFMLSTLGFLVIGLGLWWSGRRRDGLFLPNGAYVRDLRFFLFSFGLAIITSQLPRSWHGWVAGVLILGYAWHAWRIVQSGHVQPDGPENGPSQPLHLYHAESPPLWAVSVQVALALFGLVVGAHFFVMALGHVTEAVTIPGFLLSVIITPIATELPEVLNSVIWLRRRKDGLAVGNVTGAMAFQASLVPALGLWLTPWQLNPWELVTAVFAWVAALWMLLKARDGHLQFGELLVAGLFYLGFLGLVLATVQ